MKLPKYNPALLPWVGAASQAVLYTFAGVEAYGNWGWLIGPGVGVTASLAVATAATSTGGKMSKLRQTITTAGIIGMVALSPAVIALSIAVPDSPWTAIAWGAAVDVSIVLAGAVAGNKMVAGNPPPVVPQPDSKPVQATGKPKGKKGKLQQAERKQLTDDALLAELASNPDATQAQLAVIFGVSRQAIGQRLKGLRVPQKEQTR